MGQRLVITRREAAERAGSHPGRRRRAATPGSTSTTCASASWRLLGARAARARALAKAREQAAEEAGMVLGRLRGATSQQLGEAARRLGARLHRHQAALAAGLSAAVERGGGLLADAEDHRQRRTAELDRLAQRLQEVEAFLRPASAAPGGQPPA
jgi:hypothetical protein